MSTIRFEAELFEIGSWTILRLPKSASAQLPSRGMTMVEGTINGFPFQAALEPDGKGSHWLRVDKTMREGAGADAGDTVMLAIEPAREWTEPQVPEDLKSAFAADPAGTYPMDGLHDNGALGLDPLDKRNCPTGNA